MKLRTTYNPISGIIAIVAFFGIIYSLISIVNHYNFRSYALDMGAYTNALYDYIHFQWNDSTVFKELSENLLADHFDLYLILLSPLSLIFGTYTLPLVQVLCVVFGGLGIYKYFSISATSQRISIFATLYFYLFFGVFAALATDYHSNVPAACLVPWFFYFLKQKRIWATSLILLLILISKENTSLWMAFISLGLVFEYRKDHSRRNVLLVFSAVSLAYFILMTTVVMPSLSNNSSYPHFDYSFLGNTFSEALAFLLQHPIEAFKALFINHSNLAAGDFVKLEFHGLLLLSGLPILVFRPQYFVMLIPLYFQKLFHDNITIWGIHGQYSIEFAPILALGIFSFLAEMKNPRQALILSIIVLTGTLAATLRIMDHTVLPTNKAQIRFYQASHYTRDYDVSRIHKQLRLIPKDAIVSVQSPFLPHLSLRETLYQFPIIKDAEYIIYSHKENAYPLDAKEFARITTSLENSTDWEFIYKSDDLAILKRKRPGGR